MTNNPNQKRSDEKDMSTRESAYEEMLKVLGKKNQEINSMRSDGIVLKMQVSILEQKIAYALDQMNNIKIHLDNVTQELESLSYDKEASGDIHQILRNILCYLCDVKDQKVDWTLRQFSPKVDRKGIINSYPNAAKEEISNAVKDEPNTTNDKEGELDAWKI